MEMRTFKVTINFGEFVGCDKTYEVVAYDEAEAANNALAEAMGELEVEEVEEVEDEEE